MHRSRLCAILLDCSAPTMAAGVRFWQHALGVTARDAEASASPYVTLAGGAGGLEIMLQRVQDASRVHLDIETDNVEAEVQRLERLGARRKASIETWWVMEDPCGHLFCVVSAHTEAFAAQAQVWDAATALAKPS
jgi:predicted enzyme related to lactoylglutathione lyase